MATDKKSALKTLHTRMHDSIDGYEAAKDRTDSPFIKGMIDEMLADRRSDMMKVHGFLTAMGENVEHKGSALGSAHQSFLKLKDMVTGAGDEAVLQEIVRGEEHLLEAYDDALEATGAGDAEYTELNQQYAKLKGKVEQFRQRAQAA
ncbi:MAG: PA2169 family four-helix-bundle protein [Hasllibacter sp.]